MTVLDCEEYIQNILLKHPGLWVLLQQLNVAKDNDDYPKWAKAEIRRRMKGKKKKEKPQSILESNIDLWIKKIDPTYQFPVDPYKVYGTKEIGNNSEEKVHELLKKKFPNATLHLNVEMFEKEDPKQRVAEFDILIELENEFVAFEVKTHACDRDTKEKKEKQIMNLNANPDKYNLWANFIKIEKLPITKLFVVIAKPSEKPFLSPQSVGIIMHHLQSCYWHKLRFSQDGEIQFIGGTAKGEMDDITEKFYNKIFSRHIKLDIEFQIDFEKNYRCKIQFLEDCVCYQIPIYVK
jgi:hypothetical protein